MRHFALQKWGSRHLLLPLIGILYCTSGFASGLYPDVQPMRTSIDVPDVSHANVSVVIRSLKGIALYRLDCHSSTYADPDFDYSGDFECRLHEVGGGGLYSTLLTEDIDQRRDWESRARFFSADLRGACATIHDFGSTRSFELRSMMLTLRIVDAKFDKQERLRALKLILTVTRDSAAGREIAKIVPLPENAPAQCGIARYFPNPKLFTR